MVLVTRAHGSGMTTLEVSVKVWINVDIIIRHGYPLWVSLQGLEKNVMPQESIIRKIIGASHGDFWWEKGVHLYGSHRKLCVLEGLCGLRAELFFVINNCRDIEGITILNNHTTWNSYLGSQSGVASEKAVVVRRCVAVEEFCVVFIIFWRIFRSWAAWWGIWSVIIL